MKKKLGSLFLMAAMTISIAVISPGRAFAAADKTYDELRLLVDVMSLIEDNYVVKKDSKELVVGAINGMVKTLDPFSQFMEPESYKEMKTETEGQFGGLGIRISMKNDWLTVITPLAGTPAYRAGILPDDRIIEIEGKSTQGLSLQDAVNKLRGTPGTKVVLKIYREGEKEPVDYTLTREVIKIETVRTQIYGKVGYLQLTEFSASSQKDLDAALNGLKAKGMTSLVFDLRNNPGGLLDIAVDVCKEFIGDGQLIVYTQGRNPESRREYRTHGKAPYEKLPLVLLVNRGSASGSEIVAGAIQDLKRGLIVGTTTFGKGSVQSVLPLSDGNALRLTTAKYYTPSGRSIHRDEKTGLGGITPDIIIEIPRETEAKLYMQSEEIFYPGKKPQTAAKQEDIVRDVALERAIEFLKARDIFVTTPKE
jgi:carboxyl-terminal processing protease